jgi:Outer membrane protein beta-barrel domain
MDENLHDIDKLFRDPIEEHEEMPSGKVWDAIDNNLDKSNIVSIKKKYNNLKKLAVALLLLLLATIVYEVQTSKTSGKGVVTNKTTDTEDNVTVDKQTTQSAKQNKAGVEDTTGTESINSNNYTTNNAVNNDDKNTASGEAVKNNDKRTVDILPKNTGAANNSNVKKKKNKDITDNALQQDENERAVVKKSTKQQTKIKVYNGAATAVTDENGNQLNDNDENKDAITGLTPLGRIKAERITGKKQSNKLQINTGRISPDASVKNSMAKNKSTKNAKPFHFSVTPFFSPQFSSNNIREESHSQNSGPGGPPPPPQGGSRDHIKKEEQHQTAFSTGVLVDIPLGKNWGIQSGVTYLNKNISIEPKKIYARLDKDGKAKYLFDCSSGYTYISSKTGSTPAVGDSINVTNSSNSLGYLGIPVGVNYTIAAGKFNIIPTVGVVTNFLVKQQIQTELIQGATKEKQTINTIQGIKPVYFNAVAGIAFEYNLNKKIALNIMPTGNFALSSINKDAAVKSYPNSFGVSGGVKIKF